MKMGIYYFIAIPSRLMAHSMTRINVIPVEELSRVHAFAEWRELPRVFRYTYKLHTAGKQPNDLIIPNDYVLGTGHMTFFCDKLHYLADRHLSLTTHLLGYHRYRLTQHSTLRDYYQPRIPEVWWNDYSPTEQALCLNRSRIAERSMKGNIAMTMVVVEETEEDLDDTLVDGHTVETYQSAVKYVKDLEAQLNDTSSSASLYVQAAIPNLVAGLGIQEETATWLAKSQVLHEGMPNYAANETILIPIDPEMSVEAYITLYATQSDSE